MAPTVQLWEPLKTMGSAPVSPSRKRKRSVELAVVTLSGGSVSQTRNEGATNWNPAWSPDGSLITYMKNPDPFNDDYDLWVVNADGSGTPEQVEMRPEGGFVVVIKQ